MRHCYRDSRPAVSQLVDLHTGLLIDVCDPCLKSLRSLDGFRLADGSRYTPPDYASDSMFAKEEEPDA